MRLKTRARVARTLCVGVVVVLALASRASASSDATDDDDDDDDAPVWVPTFFDARGMTENALDASAHNALRGIDGGRLWAKESLDASYTVTTSARFARAGEETTVTTTTRAATRNATALREHWIAAYSPANADVTKTAPVKYAVLNRVSNGAYEREGTASARFRLTTRRATTYDFVLFGSAMDVDAERAVEYGLNDAVVIARSEPVTIEDAMAPVWPRVTLPPAWRGSTARGASARVAWQSGRNASHGATLVYRVKGADAPFTRAPASTVTYEAKDLCAEPANGFGYRHPGYVHSADIVSVDAGDVVEYRVADEHGESELYEMVMPPAEGANTKTTLALFADMGRGSDDDAETWRAYGRPALNVSAALAADARRGEIDAVFLFGDLSYATGYASVWDDWSALIEPWASRVPFVSNMGNHEMDSPESSWPSDRVADLYGGNDSGGECGVPATRLYPTPRAGPDADWFAVTFGSIRVVSMNTEVDFSPSSPQAAWLERELSAIDRSKTPWVILGGHRPGIIDSTDGPDDRETAPGMKNPSDLSVMDELQRDVWPLLVKYGVDLAFWGHNHVYQRSCAWRAIGQGSFNASDGCVSYSQKGEDGVATYVEPTAPVSVVVGTGGAKHTKNGLGQPFVEKAFHEFGYIRLTAVDATRLRATYREAGSGENGKVLDEFVVVKTRPITDSKSSVADQLEKALVSARTWRDTSYVMALFVVATVVIGTWIVIRRDGPYATGARARSTNADGFVRIDEFDDLSRGDEAT